MELRFLIILIALLVIIIIELSAWKLFRRKVRGLLLPRELGASFFRFFTMGHIRICVALHTLVLMSVTGFSIYFLW